MHSFSLGLLIDKKRGKALLEINSLQTKLAYLHQLCQRTTPPGAFSPGLSEALSTSNNRKLRDRFTISPLQSSDSFPSFTTKTFSKINSLLITYNYYMRSRRIFFRRISLALSKEKIIKLHAANKPLTPA